GRPMFQDVGEMDRAQTDAQTKMFVAQARGQHENWSSRTELKLESVDRRASTGRRFSTIAAGNRAQPGLTWILDRSDDRSLQSGLLGRGGADFLAFFYHQIFELGARFLPGLAGHRHAALPLALATIFARGVA